MPGYNILYKFRIVKQNLLAISNWWRAYTVCTFYNFLSCLKR